MRFVNTRRRLLRRAAQLGLVALAVGFGNGQPARAAATSPTAFVQGFADEVAATLRRRDRSQAERLRAVDGLVADAFALDRIARAALGRYWRAASEVERGEFATLFKASVLASYGRRFDEYADRRVKVAAASPAGEHVMVASQVEGGSTPIRLDWRVVEIGGRWQVLDVVVEGVSLTLTYRNEFAAVIEQRGGTVMALIQELRNRTSRLGSRATS